MPGRDELDEIGDRDPVPDYGVPNALVWTVRLVIVAAILAVFLFMREIGQ